MRLFLSLLVLLVGCHRAAPQTTASSATTGDSAFAAVQSRGQVAMGVDQYTSQHVFEDLPDGGRVLLVREDSTDSAGVATIRAHIRDIASRFTAGDFAIPGFVHDREVPGTRVMTEKKGSISYTPIDRPGGGELRIATSDPDAIVAIHEFLAFQRMDHHAAGHEGHQ